MTKTSRREGNPIDEIADLVEEKHQDMIDFMNYLKAREEEGAKHG